MANTIGWGSGTANNSIGWGQGKTNNTIDWGEIYDLSPSGETDLVGVIPPTSLTSPVVSGSGVVGQTLSTTDGTWSGTLPITFTYQWNRNGSIILGATFNTYTLVTADASTSIDCTVTATNAGGSLSKNSNVISVAAATDADANAFIAAAAITDTTQKAAIDKLVVDLKSYGIWTKMKALYPFIGGTAAQHKYNLRNPLDTDAAYRLTFNGGITHSANGIQGNAINGYYQTFINPSVVFSPTSGGSQFIYSRTDLDTGVDLGALAFQPSLSRFYFISRLGANQTEFACLSGGVSTPTNVNSQGFFGITREPNAPNYYAVLNTNYISTTDAYQEPNSTITGLGLIADTGQALSWSARQQAFACIADGLTVAEAQNLRLANLTFQTTLGRNV